MNYKLLTILVVVCLASVAGVAWYESLPHSAAGRSGGSNYWVIYTLTPNGNHTQIETVYYNGNNYTQQIYWLNFENRTAVYNYFKCTPSMKGCTLDGCSFSVQVDTAAEYQVKTGEPCS